MSGLLILDCTVTVPWFMPDEFSEASQAILSDILDRKVSMTVPSLWWFETINVLKTSVRRKRLDEQAARNALFLLKGIPMEVIGPEKQGQAGILTMTLAENLSAYDATYLHLAVSSGVELYTADSDLLKLGKKYPCIKSPIDYKPVL